MDCEKIQAVLSEYLDRTLNNDLKRNVKEHLLVCKKCGNVYFSMKSAVEELAGLEKIKAPEGFLNSVNQALDRRSWIKDTFNIFSGYKIPMEFVTLAATAGLVILIFTNLQPDRNNTSMVSGPDQSQTESKNIPGLMVSGTDPVDLDFYMHNKKDRKQVSSDNVVTVGSGSQLRENDISDFFAEIDDSFPLLRKERAISEINDLISLMEGDILSRDYQPDSALPDIITIRIPSSNYKSFIDRIEKVGRFKPPAPSLSDNPPDSVLLKIRLNLPE